MTQFTKADVKNEQFIYASREDLVYAPLPWQKLGLQQTASGYGEKLTSPYKIYFEGRLYRLYVMCYSNVGCTWFTARGKKYFVN